MMPAGVTRVAAPGGGVPGTVNVSPLLHSPLVVALAVTTHHCPAPGFRTTSRVSEHVPVPLAQPASVAVYQCRTRPPELSSIQSRYRGAVTITNTGASIPATTPAVAASTASMSAPMSLPSVPAPLYALEAVRR